METDVSMFSSLTKQALTDQHERRRVAWHTALGVAIFVVSACHGMLDVSDPTLIQQSDVANASGAAGRRLTAYSGFNGNISPIAREVAIFTDELSFDEPLQRANPSDELLLDSRNSNGYEGIHLGDDPHLGRLDGVVTATSLAIPSVRQYTPSPLKGDFLAQLFAYRGWALTQMGEDVCPGFPITDVTVNQVLVYSKPYTNDSAFVLAITQLDSAIAEAQDSTQYATFAKILKGRALLDLGRYDEAAQAVAGISDSFVLTTDPSYSNYLFNVDDGNDPDWPFYGYPIGDREGGTGLPYLSEQDTIRIPRRYVRQGFNDTTIAEYAETKYSQTTPTVVASGTEARLIEAEAALHNNDPNWLTILNALRTPVGLSPLTDPGSPDTRVDLLYHERAYWMWLTGRRLGDLRRLIRNYGRDATVLFPSGPNPFIALAPYQSATAIPFSFANEAEFNPNITQGCMTR